MTAHNPSLVVIGGPNGAGKSTVAPALLRDVLGIREFVNADTIAQGLSAFDPQRAAMAAGRIMLARLHELAAQRISFAFETTLASRSFAPWIKDLKTQGYRFHLIFLWVPSVEIAVARVAYRVHRGGHSVPEDVIRRRYLRGARNFFDCYVPLANTWRVYDNPDRNRPHLIAMGKASRVSRVVDRQAWEQMKEHVK